MLDADALAGPWQVKLGGRVHTARPVSVDQVRAWSEAHRAAGTLPDERFRGRLQHAALHRLFRRAFPWRWRYLWRREEDPLWHLWRRPKPVQEEVVADFFGYLGILDRPTIPRTGAASSSSGPSPDGSPPAPAPGSGAT